MSNSFKLCIVLVAGLFVAGCSAGTDVALARSEIAHFRELMAAQQFDQIYSAASDDFKKAATQQDFVNLLSAVERKLGAMRGTEESGWRVMQSLSGSTITLGFKTQFERGAGDETFIFRVKDGKALLLGYHINSNALVTI
jgi:Protein of unknown function (DUF4019)